jgi:hypothetical protein
MAGTDTANGGKQGCFTTRPSFGVNFENERPGEVAPVPVNHVVRTMEVRRAIAKARDAVTKPLAYDTYIFLILTINQPFWWSCRPRIRVSETEIGQKGG